jgi:MFS family permease
MSADIAISTSSRHGTYRRIMWRLLPFLMFCDMFSVIDRVNLSFAKLQFMRDLSLSEATFGAAVGAFYIGFALFGIPSTLLSQRYGIRKTLLRIMGLWGLVTLVLAFASSNVRMDTGSHERSVSR